MYNNKNIHFLPYTMDHGDILIADDDATFTNFFCYDCERHNLSLPVRVVETAQAAIEAIEKQAPKVLVLDLRMPGENGFSVLEHLRGKGIHLPVIVLTNYDLDEYRTRCERLGVHRYYVKSKVRVRTILEEIRTEFVS